MAICSDCAKNPYLRERIERDGSTAHCSECDQPKERAFATRHLATIISDVIQQRFEVNPQRYVFRDDDRDYTEPYGDSLDLIVADMLEQDIKFFDDLLEEILNTDGSWPLDGDINFFETGDLYSPVEWTDTADYFYAHWKYIVDELKHKRRFFSETVRHFFDSLFKDVENVKTWKEDALTTQSVVQHISQGMRIYRGRIIEAEDAQKVISQPFQHVGPPPSNKARSGRMNAEGVVVLYGAMDKETAIAELRPAIGSTVALIELDLTRPLRLLNFERLERALDEGLGAYLAYDYPTVRNTREFLKRLHDLISSPVIPGHEADYLVTQTMAEYLAHVHPSQFDGVIFKSAQNSLGMNVVLFPEKNFIDESNNTFPITYVTDSLSFYQTKRVNFEHAILKPTYSTKAGLSLVSDIHADFSD